MSMRVSRQRLGGGFPAVLSAVRHIELDLRILGFTPSTARYSLFDIPPFEDRDTHFSSLLS
jgi:hypothetical protein